MKARKKREIISTQHIKNQTNKSKGANNDI